MINLPRLKAIAQRELREILHDPTRLMLAFLAPILLMLVFSYGMNMDIKNIPYTVVDQDHSQYSRDFLAGFAHSKYFQFKGNATSNAQAEKAMVAGKTQLIINIPPHFARDLLAQKTPQVGVFIDGTNPTISSSTKSYYQAMVMGFTEHFYQQFIGTLPQQDYDVQTRFWYNQAMETKYTFVPGMIAVILLSIPAILSALSVVREKELGAIMNFYVTPTSKLEYLWGKQIPYVLLNLINLCVLFFMALLLFQVPIKGNIIAFFTGGFLYILVATSLGLLMSSFTKTQIASIMITFILTLIPSFLYSGLMTPISSLPTGAFYTAKLFPTVYFVNISVGTFTKGLGFASLWPNYLALLAFFTVFSSLSCLLLRKQER